MTPEAKIKIGDKEVGLAFGYTCYKEFIMGLWMHQSAYYNTEDGLTVQAQIQIIYSAYRNYCLNNRIPFTVLYDEFAEWHDEKMQTEEGKKEIGALLDMYASSHHVKKMMDKISDEEKKTADHSQPSPTLTT